MVEHLAYNETVGGSSPSVPTVTYFSNWKCIAQWLERRFPKPSVEGSTPSILESLDLENPFTIQ